MAVGIREQLCRVLDRLIFRIATRRFGIFGAVVTYQPLPWMNLLEGRRATGSQRRLEAIMGHLEARSVSPGVTLDVGANIGYFSLTFAQRGAIAYAVESEPLNVRIANIASQRIGSGTGAFVPIRIWCRPETVGRLPDSDVTLCLSIWHHWVRHMGLDSASAILAALLAKTSKVLFFDTGENEMPEHYDLPFRRQDAKAWLMDYLGRFEGVGRVHCLGQFEAFLPGADEKSGEVRRHLFALEKR